MILNLSEHNSEIQSLIPLSRYGTILKVAETVCSLVFLSLNLSRIDKKCMLHRPTAFIWLIFEMTHCDSTYCPSTSKEFEIWLRRKRTRRGVMRKN